MKLDSVKVFLVSNPPPGFGGRYFVFLKLKTACGIEGVGEVYAATFGPKVVGQMIEDLFARRFAGRDPFQIESLWRESYGSGFSLRPDLSLMGVISGLEMACWDIIGKAVDSRSTISWAARSTSACAAIRISILPTAKATSSITMRTARRARGRVRRAGFHRSQVRSHRRFLGLRSRGNPPRKRSNVPCAWCAWCAKQSDGAPICSLGTHGQFTTSGAIRLARQLEPYDPLWFEEPVPPEMPEQMAIVARGTSIPIATGERLTTKYEFARVLASGAANIIQMNLGRVGGLLEAKKVAALAEVHYAQIAPHLYCGPVVGAANIQIATCSPNFLILESIQQWGGIHAQLLKNPIRWEQGYVIPPTAPGLGVELNEAVARANAYVEESPLHLEMIDRPLG